MVEAEICPYYKMRRLDLLHNAAHCHKMRTLLQNAAIVIIKYVAYNKMCRYYKMQKNRCNWEFIWVLWLTQDSLKKAVEISATYSDTLGYRLVCHIFLFLPHF